MKISIARRDRPFSHLPGASCMLPRTCWSIQAFPARILLRNREIHSSDDLIDIPLKLQGPVREFTLQQDLENGMVVVSGIAQEGAFRLCFQAKNGVIQLSGERIWPSGMICGDQVLCRNELLTWKVSGIFCENVPRERLSLGNHRLSCWEKVWPRFDFSEIFPAIFHLSHWIPKNSECRLTEMHELLHRKFTSFLQAAFYGILCPRLLDDAFQGLLNSQNVHPEASPISLIIDAGAKIRSMFIQQEGKTILLLPSNDFLAGRMIDVQLAGIGMIDFEWSKGNLRRAILHADQDARVQLKLSNSLRSFRLRSAVQSQGYRQSIDDGLDLKAGNIYFMDRFQK